MFKITFVLSSIFFCSVVSGQNFTENVDGSSIVTEKSYLNDSLRKSGLGAIDYISVYQKYISGIRGQECPMYPSCSNYGLKTFSEKSFVTAFVLTADRLLRCGHDHSNYSLTLRPNGFKNLDYPDYDKPPLDLYFKRNSYFFAYSDTIKDDSTLLFVKKLINNQFFREALLEIVRVEYQINSFNIDLFINKIICLKAIGEYEKALFEYDNKCPELYKNNSELAYQIALIQYKLQNFDNALKSTFIALETCNDSFCKPKILLLNGLLYANKNDWQNAMKIYKTLSAYEHYQNVSDMNFQLSENAINQRSKSKTVAGVISIIPGLGYAYTGHRQTAISSLLVNGLLAYATFTNFNNKNYGMGILTGILNLSFYVGNFYGAIKSAKRYNDQQKMAIINKIEYNSQF